MYWRNDNYEVRIFRDAVFCRGFGRYATYSGDTLTIGEFHDKEIRRSLGKYIEKKTVQRVEEAIKRREAGEWHSMGYTIGFMPAEISFCTIDRFGGTGTSCMLENFLEGEYQETVRDLFGEKILSDIIRSAEAVLKGEEPPVIHVREVRGSEKEEIPADRSTLQKLVTWVYGMDFEYNYSAWIYKERIIWKLEMDEQWGGGVEEISQTLGDFLSNGVPDKLNIRGTIPAGELAEITDFIKLDEETRP